MTARLSTPSVQFVVGSVLTVFFAALLLMGVAFSYWLVCILLCASIGFATWGLNKWEKTKHWSSLKRAFSVVAACLLAIIIVRWTWANRDRFAIRVKVAMVNSGFFYRYRSNDGSDRLAPIGLQMNVEVTPRTSVASKISDYFVDLEADGEWVRLYNLRPDNLTALFFVEPDRNFRHAFQWDFTATNFDTLMRNHVLPVDGWIFLEWPPNLRGIPNQVRRLRFRLRDTEGYEQVSKVVPPVSAETEEPGSSVLGVEVGRFIGYADISGISILPRMDDKTKRGSIEKDLPTPTDLVNVLEWLNRNKEWLFSGAGLALVYGIAKLIGRLRRPPKAADPAGATKSSSSPDAEQGETPLIEAAKAPTQPARWQLSFQEYIETLDRLEKRFFESDDFEKKSIGREIDWTGFVMDVYSLGERVSVMFTPYPPGKPRLPAAASFQPSWRTKLFALQKGDKVRVRGRLMGNLAPILIEGESLELIQGESPAGGSTPPPKS